MPPKAEKKPTVAGKAPAGKAPAEKKEAGKKTACKLATHDALIDPSADIIV